MIRFERRVRSHAAATAILCAIALSACGGGSSTGIPGRPARSVRLEAVHFGRLADVYGLRRTTGGTLVAELHQRDVMVGPDIQDQRDSRSRDRRDDEILYDFLGANPDDLQPRLLITREIGTPEFEAALAAVSVKLRLVAPARFGQDTGSQPFSVVPRNAALQLTFSGALPIDDGFFVERDARGQVQSVRNLEAVQLLEIAGDPTDQQHGGDFRLVPVRYVVRERHLILDPVLLGSEGLQHGVKNSATGLPASPDQQTANIRLALAVEGTLRLPGFEARSATEPAGRNLSGAVSVVRDFRSGNAADDSSDLSRGFVRDAVPPRLLGTMVMYLEAVEDVDATTQRLSIFKGDVAHRIDAGDVVQLVVDDGGVPAVSEVVRDPQDHARERRAQVLVRRAAAFADHDPRRLPGHPGRGSELDGWLLGHAPRIVLVAPYEAGDPSDPEASDDPRLFLRFTPSPLWEVDGYPQVSPFAGVLVRFDKPMDLASVKSLDTLFFATRPMLGPLAEAEIRDFIAAQEMDPASFSLAKYVTPHLVAASRYDENGSQTTLRLQPKLGFYLDDRMRLEDPQHARYFLHLVGGAQGVKDLAGNALDLQAAPGKVVEALVVGFDLDTRRLPSGEPLFANNLVVTVARRFADADEDEQPSLHRKDEVARPGSPTPERAQAVPDLFGGVVYLADGRLQARPAARVSRIVDDLNQVPPPAQFLSRNPDVPNPRRHCPDVVDEVQVASATASVKFGQPLQNPLNPFGCRLQMLWREIDMSLSRDDASDFNLDVEQLHWAPFGGGAIGFDEFDRASLHLGHSEWRPEPCVGEFNALPTFWQSGLELAFDGNWVRNVRVGGGVESAPAPHAAFLEQPLVIDANRAFLEPNGINRFMPLPTFQKPYFVWRDETVVEQGAVSKLGSDVGGGAPGYRPYLLSPFLFGNGRAIVSSPSAGLQPVHGFWNNALNFRIRSRQADAFTDGLVGSIALPLLAEWKVWPDSPDAPAGRGYVASGANGWQIAITVQSGINLIGYPYFRVYSGGASGVGRQVEPLQEGTARGGWTPNGVRTNPGDNSLYWVQADFLKRQTVITSGFVELANPHRMPAAASDPRLGPYLGGKLQGDRLPVFDYEFEPPLAQLPSGTGLAVEFRGAGEVDSWYADIHSLGNPPLVLQKPDESNFPLDPRKAGDAHVRKYDDRAVGGGAPRDHWTYTYTRHLTTYVADANRLMEREFVSRFAAANESFLPQDVRYVGWRFVVRSNVEASPPVSPALDSFTLVWRFEQGSGR